VRPAGRTKKKGNPPKADSLFKPFMAINYFALFLRFFLSLPLAKDRPAACRTTPPKAPITVIQPKISSH
jgi:hypothetical protein